MEFELFNLRQRDRDGNIFTGKMPHSEGSWEFADGIIGPEQERFDRWIRSQVDGINLEGTICQILETAKEDINPVYDCWRSKDNIFYVLLHSPDGSKRMVAFFQRGPVHEIYEGFMERMQGLIEQAERLHPVAELFGEHLGNTYTIDVLPFCIWVLIKQKSGNLHGYLIPLECFTVEQYLHQNIKHHIASWSQ